MSAQDFCDFDTSEFDTPIVAVPVFLPVNGIKEGDLVRVIAGEHSGLVGWVTVYTWSADPKGDRVQIKLQTGEFREADAVDCVLVSR